MSQPERLIHVVQTLTDLGIDHMVTGSIASSLYGEPRSTHDIDLVVSLPADKIAGLVSAFPPPEYYLSEDAIRLALREHSMFNLLSLDDGEKVDFWILKDDAFDRSMFARRRHQVLFGTKMNVGSPEDIILAKLRWAILSGGSERQMKDVLRIFEVQRGALDFSYLNRWAALLGVDELWKKTQADAVPE